MLRHDRGNVHVEVPQLRADSILDAVKLGRGPALDGVGDPRAQLDRLVGQLEICERAPHVGGSHAEQLTRLLVGQHEHTVVIDRDLRDGRRVERRIRRHVRRR